MEAGFYALPNSESLRRLAMISLKAWSDNILNLHLEAGFTMKAGMTMDLEAKRVLGNTDKSQDFELSG